MRSITLFRKFAAVLIAICSAFPVFAQKPQTPKQEKLLNGMKVLIWNDPSAKTVSVKVRIHSGSAFDPQGKEGLMAMLAENFFPNDGTKEFFKDDLGGSLSVTANYDFMQINASSKTEEFLTMLEAVATAVSNPPIDKETAIKLRDKRLERLKELEKDPAYVADAAVAKRLFGTFPYGRPELGTADSVLKITFADLLEAKQRFLGADNATVSIFGNIDSAFAFRAARRYFGSWLKSDKIAPSTFRQPDDPDTKLATIVAEGDGVPLVRFAFRGLARNDRDYAASAVLTFILEDRLKQNVAANKENATVRHCAHILPGIVVFSFPMQVGSDVPGNLPTLLLSKAITNDEFSSAKARITSAYNGIAVDEFWLNADTFKLTSAADDLKLRDAVTLSDVQRVAERLGKNPVVAITLKAPEKTAVSN